MNPTEEICTAINNEVFCFAALADTTKGTIYSDLTGRFPLQSYAGMQYIFIAYIYDQNYIIIRPMKNRSEASMVEVFQDVYRMLQQRGTNPSLHVMDNECSKAIKTFVADQKTTIQLVEPHNHRVNAAEVAVKTAKYHFIASLATVAPECPLQLWCSFLPQVETSLNLLRTSRRNPMKSAYGDLHGAFDYNKTPMVPIGTLAVVYEDPDDHGTWAPHGTDTYYVEPAMEHYRN